MKTIEERLELLEAQMDGEKLRKRIAELELEVERLSYYESELLRLKCDLGIPDGKIIAQCAINAVNDYRKLLAVLLPDAPRINGTEGSWLGQQVDHDKHGLNGLWRAQVLVADAERRKAT